MNPFCLFIPSTVLPFRRQRHSNICLLQRPLRMSASKDDEGIGEPSWMELSRSLGGNSDQDPDRPAPQWKMPEGDLTDFGDEPNPWNVWNSSLKKEAEEQVVERDPKAETDFWRGAAKEVVSDSSNQPETPLSSAENDSSRTPEELWGQARNVTGEMSEVQEKLRSELERFDLDETKDQYRDIARELVGPPPEPWDDAKPLRSSETESNDDAAMDVQGKLEAEAGSGWNPDVDWMRFDDIRRDQAKKMEREERKKVMEEAQRQRDERSANITSEENVTYTDEDGRELSTEEVQRLITEGAVFMDESGKEIEMAPSSNLTDTEQSDAAAPPAFDPNAPIDQLPGFLANKSRSQGTYGANWSGAESEMKALQEKGVPLRDPKAEADAWRSAARELNFEIEPASDDAVDAEDAKPTELEQNVDNEEEESSETSPVLDETEALLQDTSDETRSNFNDIARDSEDNADESSLWSSWRSGSANWEDAVSTAPPRDPKQEVDMWRGSARELTSDVSPSAENSGEESANQEEKSLWNQWRNADKNWMASLDQADQASSSDKAKNTWSTEGENSDWGSGLDSKTSSDRSAWETWNNAGGQAFGEGFQSRWWESRSDLPVKNDSAEKNSKRTDVDQWRQIARETNPNGSVVENQFTEDDGQEKGKGAAIEFWKTAVKDISIETNESEETGGDNR